MNEKLSKIFAGVSGALIFIAVIFYLVNAGKSLGSIPSGTDYYDSLRTVSVIQIILEVIVLIMALITIGVSFHQYTLKKTSINCLLITLVILALEKLIAIIGAYIILKKYVYSDVSLDGGSIAIIIFVIFTLICAVAAQICFGSERDVPGAACGAVAAIWFFIVIIIALANGTGNTLSTLYLVFILITCFTIIAASVLAGIPEPRKPTPPLVHPNFPFPKPAPAPTPASKPQVDAVEELMKLKKLLDAGAITQEEFDEKRKKYVDKL